MRLWTILANALALLFCLALFALFVWLVGRVGFMGALVTGLVVLLMAYNVELQEGTGAGASYLTGRLDTPRQVPSSSPEERLAQQADRAATLKVIALAKHAGAALVTIGALGFFFVQLQ